MRTKLLTAFVALCAFASAQITISSSQTNASCYTVCDGSATVTATGGSGSYTYTWTPSGGSGSTASGLCAGAFTVTVADGVSTPTTAVITITEPGPISSTITSAAATCGSCNGTATVSVQGSGNGYTYLWAPTGGTGTIATGLCPGTYTCTLTKNGCTATQTVAIAAGTLMATLSYTNVSCFGYCDGAATMSASGGSSPYAYTWTPVMGIGSSISNLCVGTYTGTVSDGTGCSFPAIFTITQPASFSGAPTATPATCGTCANGSATANYLGGSGQYSFSWSPGGQTTPTASGLLPGTYTVCVTKNSSGCMECNSVVVSSGMGIKGQGAGSFAVFPNPSSGIFKIRSEGDVSRVDIFNLIGEKVFSCVPVRKADDSYESRIDLRAEPKGIYFFHLLGAGKTEGSGKIIIE